LGEEALWWGSEALRAERRGDEGRRQVFERGAILPSTPVRPDMRSDLEKQVVYALIAEAVVRLPALFQPVAAILTPQLTAVCAAACKRR